MKKQFWSIIAVGFIALNFIACGKKSSNNGTTDNTPICTNGYYNTTTGQCVGSTGTGSNNPFYSNGNITYASGFRDLVQRTFNRPHECHRFAYIGCEALQLQVRKINDNSYQAFIRSPSMYGTTPPYNIAGFTYTGNYATSQSLPQGGFSIEVYTNNPYPHIELEVVIGAALTQSQAPYQIYFNRRVIANGTMIKGRDY